MGQYQSSERTYQDEIRRLQIQKAEIDVQKAASEAQKAAIGAQKAEIVLNTLLIGAAALFVDHLLRGTRFGRKFCVKSRLMFSPSRLFQPKEKKLIADENRAQMISDALSVSLPTIFIG